MTLEQLIQVYAPLAGLLGAFFWLGVLSNRVHTLEKAAAKVEAASRTERDDFGRLIALETEMKTVITSLAEIKRGMDGVQRQLANLMGAKPGVLVELPGSHP
jgi:hypothetical protein